MECRSCGCDPCVHPHVCNRPPDVPHIYTPGDKVQASPSWRRNPDDSLIDESYEKGSALMKFFMDGGTCIVKRFNEGKNIKGTVEFYHPDFEGTEELWEPWCSHVRTSSMHVDDFHKGLDAALPEGYSLEQDYGGQIVIYTGLMWGAEDNVIPFEESPELEYGN